MLDTPYWARPIRRIGVYLHGYGVWQKVDTPCWNCEYAFSGEDLALIRRISFPGYGVLVRNRISSNVFVFAPK
ncbi:hypothetical protein Tco_0010543 [Tanacetum coccineum]